MLRDLTKVITTKVQNAGANVLDRAAGIAMKASTRTLPETTGTGNRTSSGYDRRIAESLLQQKA